jgi:dimeric dUTPase (all-alpha-NTP-PPase superfamily)
MNGKYILGGGISGLLYAYYNRDFTVISPDIGGKLNNSFFENIFYLHATDSTEVFLRDIGVEYSKKTQLIKYIKDNKLIRTITTEDKKNFIRKKLNDPSYDPKDLNLSTSDYYISVFEIDYSELLDRLKNNLKYIDDSVIKITDDEVITETTRYKYNKIVSTLNSKIFWDLYHKGNTDDLRSEMITFVLCDRLPDELEESKFDLCYFVDTDNAITRISKRRRDQSSSFLYEFSGYISKSDCERYLPEGSEILEYYVEKDGLIFTNKNNIPPSNVLFVGRFATWNHSDKQQDVIEAAKIDFEIQNLWNIQKRFTSNFVDFERLSDQKTRESLTKDYFVALMPELSEVLNEINYKQHKANKPVDRDKLLEELIDVFKYYLNILLMWDITPREFVEMFKRKSKIVSQQYEDHKKSIK